MIFNELNDDLLASTVIRILMLLREILDNLSLKGLTSDERKTLQSVADGRLAYVQKAVQYCKDNRAKIGMSQEDLDELERYGQMFADLSHLFSVVETLYSGLRDTKMQAGAILYRLSRGAHAQMKLARDKGKPGIEPLIDSLDKLFENQGGSGDGNDPAPTDGGDGPDNGPVSPTPQGN